MVEGMQIEGETPKRGPGRPSLRAAETLRPDTRMDSVREAEEYAQSILDAMGTDNYNPDEFYISPEEIPDGWSYQWKATAVVGKENTYHTLELKRSGWREVMAERHPYKMPKGYTGAITIKGLTLMELPKVLTDKAERAHIRESKEVLRNSEKQLYETPTNTGPRDDPKLNNRITREYVSSKPGRSED